MRAGFELESQRYYLGTENSLALPNDHVGARYTQAPTTTHAFEGSQRSSLKVCEENEEEDPEDPHGVPVPGGTINQDLACFELARGIETAECQHQARDSEEKVDSVGVRDEVEEVTTWV